MTTRAGSGSAHLTEEELILHHYGEEGARPDAGEHLGRCATCRAEELRLRETLALVASDPVPERDARYGEEVWHRLRPRLPAAPGETREETASPRRWAMAAAVTLMVVSAFLAGRFSRPPSALPAVQAGGAIPAPVRERILLVAVGDHLEKSQMMLVELLNADGGPSVDIGPDRRRAEELVSAGRLYRQSATEAGDAALASVLDDLERVLLDIAHGPATLSHTELQEVQRRIREKGILLTVRLIGSQVREKEKSAAAGNSGARV